MSWWGFEICSTWDGFWRGAGPTIELVEIGSKNKCSKFPKLVYEFSIDMYIAN
jgi:hypothetical protein